jgi:AraC-like DNA-binding protein
MPAPPDDVARAKRHIEQHLTHIESPREVAVALDVSYETLRKQFRRAVGVPMGQYIRQARVDRARKLLIATDDPVHVVCRRVGFASDTSGIRTFGRATGLTMAQYRRRYRDGEASD